MSGDFQCSYCIHYFSNRNALFQHMKICINTFDSSTEESNEEVSVIISDVNDMSLDNEEFQSVLENLPSDSIRKNLSVTQDLFEFEEYEEYAGDDSLISSNIPNSELFEEILQSEESRNSELVEEML